VTRRGFFLFVVFFFGGHNVLTLYFFLVLSLSFLSSFSLPLVLSWRKLEGSDPKRYELIQKIQTLQKRLISKTESVVEKDLLLSEKEKLYVELKNLLARQPGPEVAEQLSKYQHTLKEKTRQMKAMAAELNMLQAQVNEYRYEIERTTRELQDTKRKFFDSRRKEQMANERARGDATALDPMTEQQRIFLATQPRITGGGFNLQAMNATQ